ncbi:hypothetical protein [Echinicola shivajiensis]|uniref:hypothetical protein n=1 Tax=Echinicola shivajiensis TaxID=1035916 RepID=UPI001FE29E47|nr:hypothetical protein [Echinicola shivajiensis]
MRKINLDMKMTKSIALGIICLAFMVSCGGVSEQEALKDEVIKIHDEVMPKMGELKSEEKRLLDLAKQYLLEDSVNNIGKAEKIKKAASNLEKAYDGMFVWMRQFKADLSEMEEEEAISYLNGQKEMVSEVNEDIKKALEEAKKIEE